MSSMCSFSRKRIKMKKQEQCNTSWHVFFFQAPVKLVQRDINKTRGTHKLDFGHSLSQRAAGQVIAQIGLRGSAGMFSGTK